MVRPARRAAAAAAVTDPLPFRAMDLLTDPNAWIALLTLTVLEIVLGIDNVVFISVLVQRLPAELRDRARTIGLGLAMGMRILLLLTISWIVGLTEPLFTIADHPVSVRDTILIAGGLFLIWKATTEIHEALEGAEGHGAAGGATATMGAVLFQVAAVMIAVGVMLFASGPISRFVHEHPTVKMLALSFLLLIGVTLIADGAGLHVPKGYIYAAMGFSVFVEALNLWARRRGEGKAVALHPTFVKDDPDTVSG